MAEADTTDRLRNMRARAEAAPPAPRRGRPKVKRAPEPEYEDEEDLESSFEPAANRRAARRASRDATRDTIENTRRGAMVVTGRNGEKLTRRRTQMGDPYHVPEHEIPTGWSYQWNPVTVLNQEVTRMQNIHYANGWRPVPASRHPGRWTRPGDTGDILVEGLRLEERPYELTLEAVQEGEMKAKQQLRDQAESLRLTEKLPKGFAAGKKYRGTGAGVSIQIDKSLEIRPGEYEEADDER